MLNSLFTHHNKVIHCGHHKGASQWIHSILIELSKKYYLNITGLHSKRRGLYLSAYGEFDILQDGSSAIILDHENYVGCHLVRDPRDMIVSGYFYHQWTDEKWCNLYDDRFGMSYQEKIKSLSPIEGLQFEIDNVKAIAKMEKWNYSNPKMLELRYETLLENSEVLFTRLFRHLGVRPIYLNDCLDIARSRHMTAQTGRKVGEVQQHHHCRSGKPGQWKEHFTEEHKARFKEKYGPVLIKLGYEKDNDW